MSTLGSDNSGYLIIPSDCEIEAGTFNTSNSKLWSKLWEYFNVELKEEWAKMRQDRFTLDNMMKYIYDEQIAKLPAKIMNTDAQTKYLKFGSLYTYCCHGSKEHHMKRWIRERIAYVDSMMDYFTSQEDQVTIRMNKSGEVSFDVTTYIPLYFSVKWSNATNGIETIKMKRGETRTFSYNSTTNTDQEILIFNAQHIKRLDNLSNLNPSSCILSNAIKLNEVEIHSTELYNINVTNNQFLRRVDLSNCPKLGTVTATGSSLDLSNCKYLKYCDVRNTALTEIQLNTSGGSLKEIYYPKTIQSIELIKQRLLETIGLPYGENGEDIPTALYNIDIEECPMINRLNMSDDDTISNTFASMVYCNNLTLRNALDLQVLSFDGFHRLMNVVIENMYNLEELGFNNLLPVGQTSTLKYVALSNCPKLEEIELNCTSDDYEITLANNAVLDFGRLYSLKNITSNCVLKGLKTLVVPNGLESMFFTNEYGSGYSSVENIWASSVCSVSLNGAVVNATHMNNGYKGIDFLGMNLKNIDLGALVNIPKAINFSLSPTHVNPNFNLNRDGQTYPYLQPEGTLDLSNYTESLAKFFNGVDLDKLTIICNNDLPQNDLSYCFYNSTFSGVESINALLSRVSNITNLDYCFYKTTISDLSVLEHVNMGTNSTMNYTFAECPNVTELRNVVIPASIVEIEGLFFKCPITSITNMNVYVNGSIAGLFKGCNKLETINTLRIPNVTSVASTFEGCSILSTLTGFELPASCTDVSNLFNGCYSLTSLGMDFGENIVSGNNWFPPNLETLYDTNISTDAVKLTGCATLKNINNLKLRVSNVDSFFDNCSSLRNINGLDIGGILTSVSGLFKDMNLTLLQNITFGNSITNFTSCFENVSCVTDDMIINMPDHTGITVDYSRMFAGCNGITKVIDTVYPNGGSNFTSMYEGCTGITRIENLTVNGKLVDAMFKGCSYVTKISNTTFNNANSMNELFMNCTRLEELDEVTFGEHVTSANDWNKNTALKYVNDVTLKNNYVKFSNCATLIECNDLKLTGNTDSIKELFYYCTNLVTCNMTSDNVINTVNQCFEHCRKLERFIVPELADKVDLYRMFTHCYAITYIEFYDKIMDLTRQHGLENRNYQVFADCNNLETIKNFKVKYYPTDEEKQTYIDNVAENLSEGGNTPVDGARSMWTECTKIKYTPNMGIYNDWAKILFFKYKSDISEFIIGDEVTDISYLFRGRPITKDIVIPSHVTNCSNTFEGCTSMTHIHSNWNNTYDSTIVSTGCYAGCTGITHIDNSELVLDEYSTCLDKIPEDWGGYGFEDSNTSVVVLDIPSDNYEVTINMRVDFENQSLFSKPPLIAWGDNSSSVGDYVLGGGSATKVFNHTYAQAGKYVVKLKNGIFDYYNDCQSFKENIYKIVSLYDKFRIIVNHFRENPKLVEANISNAVIDGAYHMMACPNLTKVIANNVKAISIANCFRYCRNLTEIIGLDTWNTDELSSMTYAFENTPLTSLDDIADWNTENVTNMSYTFQNCASLTSLDLSNWDTGKVTNMSYMFNNCSSLTSRPINIIPDSVEKISGLYKGCPTAITEDISGMVFGSGITEATDWIGKTAIKYANNVTIKNEVVKFADFTNLIECNDLTITDNVTSLENMFSNCTSLTHDIIIPSHITNVTNMFKDCTSMTHIHSNWNNSYSNNITATGCYSGCTGITHIDNSELVLDEYSTCLDKIPEEWGGYGFEDSNTSVVVLDIPSDNYEVSITMRKDTQDSFSRPPLIAWGDNSTSVGDYVLGAGAGIKDFSHTYEQAGKYVVKLKNGTFWYNTYANFRENVYKIVSLHDKFPITTNHFRQSPKLVEANISNAVIVKDNTYHMYNCPNLTKVIANNVKANGIGHCFHNCSNLTEIIGLDTWDTNELTNMTYAFADAPLTSLDDIADWNTENVVDMSSAFSGMKNITNLDFISSWDLSSVINMESMFFQCSALTSRPINVIPDNVENIKLMYFGVPNSIMEDISGMVFGSGITNCSGNREDNYWCGVKTVVKYANNITIKNNVVKFKDFTNLEECNNLTVTSNITDISEMCSGCSSLKTDFVIPNHVTNCSNAFKDCTSMTHIHSNWNNTYDNGITSTDCYAGCTGITHIDGVDLGVNEIRTGLDEVPVEWGGYGFTEQETSIFKIDLNNITDNTITFSFQSHLTTWGDGTRDSSGTHTYSKKGIYYIKTKSGLWTNNTNLFSTATMRDSLIEIIQIAGKTTLLWNTFSNCKKLEKANLSNVSNISLGSTFQYCSGLKEVIFKEGDKIIGNSNSAFYGCTKLESVVNFNNITSSDALFSNMFHTCSSLTSLDLSNWNIVTVKDMNNMFFGCSSLTSLDLSNWDTGNITNMSGMFNQCSSLTSLDDMANWNTENVTDMSYTFQNCTSLTSIDLSGWDTSSVTTLKAMFSGCTSLTSLDLSSWNVENVTDTQSIFSGCSSLTSLNLSGWVLNNIHTTSLNYMFQNCKNLEQIIGLETLMSGSKRYTGTMVSTFDNCNKLKRLDLKLWNATIHSNTIRCFADCNNIEYFDFSGIDFGILGDGIFGGFAKNTDTKTISLSCPNYTANSLFRIFVGANFSSINFEGSNFSSVKTIEQCFGSNTAVKSISFKNTNLNNVTNWDFCFLGTTNLENLNLDGCIVIDNPKINSCDKLTVTSLVSVLNALCDNTGNTTLTCSIGTTNLAKLSAEQIKIATDKNWTLV